MHDKLDKKIFNFFIDFLHFMQVVFIFLSFFIILYWILQLAGVKFIQIFAPFFEGIKNFTHIFYNRIVTIETVKIDFSFLIASLAFLLCVKCLGILIEYLQGLEGQYDLMQERVKKKKEDIFNKKLEQEYLVDQCKNNKIIILVNFCAINLSKDSFFDRDVNAGVENKKNEIMFDLLEILDENHKCQKKIIGDGVLLSFENFNNIDKIIGSLESIILELKKKYYEEKWQLNFLMAIDVYADAGEILKKTEKLISMIKIGLKNEILCLGTFKQRYSLLKNPKYYIQGNGIYQIVAEEEDVFCIKSLN